MITKPPLKIFCLSITILCFLLAGCIPADAAPASKILFVTATRTLLHIQPTEIYSTLTPLPAQVHAMTQEAKITPDRHTRIEMIAQTSTPTKTPTVPLNSFSATKTAIAKDREATAIPTVACRSDYPDFCIPFGNRKTCKELNNLGYANFTVHKPDSLNYDKNADGIGCEN